MVYNSYIMIYLIDYGVYMKSSKSTIVILFFILSLGCSKFILGDNSDVLADDELIIQIQNSTNKVEIDYNAMPAEAMSTIEKSYGSDMFLTKKYVSNLGYELTLTELDTYESSMNKIYFNVDGRKLNKKRGSKGGAKQEQCFDLVMPINFTMPDGSIITLQNDEDWKEIKAWYDSNEGYDKQRPALEFPVDLTYEDGNVVTIYSNNEMRSARRKCFECFTFSLPIVFDMPDGSSVTIDSESGWEAMKLWYDENSEYNNQFPTLQFPVELIFIDGTTSIVENEPDMKIIRQDCKE